LEGVTTNGAPVVLTGACRCLRHLPLSAGLCPATPERNSVTTNGAPVVLTGDRRPSGRRKRRQQRRLPLLASPTT